MEAEAVLLRCRQRAPVAERGLQQREGADHVGLDEFAGSVDRAVDVALGGKMHHHVGLIGLEQLAHLGRVRDVGAHKGVALIVRHRRKRVEIARIGELVDHEHAVVALADGVAHHRRADEAGAAGDEKAPRHQPP